MKVKWPKKWTRRSLLVLPICLAGVLSIIATSPPGPIVQQISKPYVLAYVDTNWRLRIRWSDDGETWMTASAATPTIDRSPGIAANPAGLVYLAIFDDTVSDARFIMGIGPASWDSTTLLVGNGHRPEIQSGTSIAYLNAPHWLVAYRHQNSAKVVTFNDSNNVRDFGPEITPVPGTVNLNVTDKPAIANMGGRVLVSWLMNNQLQMTSGTVQGNTVNWDTGYLFNATVTASGFGPPIGAHDLATDGTNFYLAVVRQRDPRPGEQLQRHFLHIYTSPNGLNWSLLNNDQEVRVPQSLGLAARATNDLMAIVSFQATQVQPAFVYLFDGAWTDIPNADVFGTNPINAGHDFTLYARD